MDNIENTKTLATMATANAIATVLVAELIGDSNSTADNEGNIYLSEVTKHRVASALNARINREVGKGE